MTLDQKGLPDAIVYMDRSDVRPGNMDELRGRVAGLVQFVERHEPQLIAYGFYFDERANQMTVTAVHPDSASLEFHLEIAGAEFRKVADLLTLRTIDVYGRLSVKAQRLLQSKAAMLGKDASVAVHEPHAAFARVLSPKT